MRAFRGVTLGTVLGVFLWLLLGLAVSHAATNPQTVWAENWANQSQWTPGSGCTTAGGVLACNPGGALKTIKKWDPAKPITVNWSMSGKAAAGSTTQDYFVGMTLWQREETPTKSNYAELALVRSVPPFTVNDHDRIGGLNTWQKPNRSWYIQSFIFWDTGTIVPGAMETFRVEWLPSQTRWNAYWPPQPSKWVNGNPFLPGLPVYIELLTVCTGEYESPNGCKADGRFGPLTVTGTQI